MFKKNISILLLTILTSTGIRPMHFTSSGVKKPSDFFLTPSLPTSQVNLSSSRQNELPSASAAVSSAIDEEAPDAENNSDEWRLLERLEQERHRSQGYLTIEPPNYSSAVFVPQLSYRSFEKENPNDNDLQKHMYQQSLMQKDLEEDQQQLTISKNKLLEEGHLYFLDLTKTLSTCTAIALSWGQWYLKKLRITN